jgi:hypothetical protein
MNKDSKPLVELRLCGSHKDEKGERCYVNCTLEYGKTDGCDNEEIVKMLQKVATEILIKAKGLE